ncbi:MAG: prolyl oligopeptidase family serine peptidase [Brevundimonas sp.]|uniref:prolyl oligopeptidase family serine peptidase n=1 Tax=Brevundimonas sp. TaxID=1871086 RepID=UPI00391C4157
MLRRLALTAIASLVVPIAGPAMTQDAPEARLPTPVAEPVRVADEDPYLWLEEIEGERAMAWVEERNRHSLGTLQGDPRYEGFYQTALEILESRDRIASPGFSGLGTGLERRVDNFWQDATHVRGIWRTTTLGSYLTDEPEWETIIDVDALTAAEGANWVWQGASCLFPEGRHCLVFLSDGGKDANEVREFDRETLSFVEGGFALPESKGGVTWIDRDTLLVHRDFGEGSLTDSGYARTIRLLRRGEDIASAPEVFAGEQSDVSVSAFTLRAPDGRIRAVMISRATSFYEAQYFVLSDEGVRQIDLPARVNIRGLIGDRFIYTTNQDWTTRSGQSFTTGDLIYTDLDTLLNSPEAADHQLIIRPGEREAVQSVTTTRNTLVVALYENVRGSIYVYRPEGAGWSRERMDLPENVTVGLGTSSSQDDQLFVSVTGYLNPSSLWLADAATGAVEQAKSLPPKFDTEGLTVTQFEARSEDGTMIPYFVVHREDVALDGSNPTLLYGYGGFQSSLLPGYSPTVGRLWLERGGIYVIANTRGGGEFGPRWHQAALRENRQRAHEDFQAVASDLIAREITSPSRLGVMGGSQGGLFMGAILTQRPDLINAAVIQVPLFDMLRYHLLLAGASWMAEYGNPDIPEERAWIAAYSPYQNLRAGEPYPEVFIHTSTKDDRVHPGHARKAAARLEELGYPVLFYENTDGGHAAGANLRETARRIALEYTYLTRRLMD